MDGSLRETMVKTVLAKCLSGTSVPDRDGWRIARRSGMGAPMTRPPQPRAAGAIIALSVIGGAIAGIAAGQPTIGTLAGFGIGVAIALLLWLRDGR